MAIPETSNVTPPSNLSAGKEFDAFDIDSLIPEELKAAVDKEELELVDEDEPVESDDNELEVAAPSGSFIEDEYPVDADLDLSLDNIDRLMDGDLDALKKTNAVEDEVDVPVWHDAADYKDLVEKVAYNGMDQAQLDEVIRNASDKRVLDSGKYTQGLQAKLKKLEESQGLYDSEIARLRQIERSAHFDSSSEVKSKYIDPLRGIQSAVSDVIDTEGLPVTANDILTAQNRIALNELVSPYGLEDSTVNKIVSQWSSYRQLHRDYGIEKSSAQKDLHKHLGTNISEDMSNKILNNTLVSFMGGDDKHSYIKEAIMSDNINEHPEVVDVVNRAKGSFTSFINALAAPSEYVNNQQWLNEFAEYTFETSHNKHIADKFYAEKETHDRTKDTLNKVVKEYRKLAASAKGISGNTGPSRMNGHSTTTSSKANKDNYNDFLNGKIDIDDLMK